MKKLFIVTSNGKPEYLTANSIEDVVTNAMLIYNTKDVQAIEIKWNDMKEWQKNAVIEIDSEAHIRELRRVS